MIAILKDRYIVRLLLFSLLLGLLLAPNLALWAQSDDDKEVVTKTDNQAEAQNFLPASLNLHQWGAITLFHGLPSNHVKAIAQDSEGVLWFGTDSGLAKYDGQRTQKILGLPSDQITTLKLMSNGELWVGTDRGAVRLIKNQSILLAETTTHSIEDIINASEEQAVVTTMDGMLFIYQISGHTVANTITIEPKDSPLLSINEKAGTDGKLPITSVLAQPNRLLLSTKGRGILTLEGQQIKELNLRPRPYFVNALAQDSSGTLWLGTRTGKEDSGLYRQEPNQPLQKVMINSGEVTSLCAMPQGDIWVGTMERGAFHYRQDQELGHMTFENTSGGLQSNQVYTIFADREGVIWFGTDRGVCRYDPASPHAEKLTDDAQYNFVRVIAESKDGKLWCGSNKGLFFKDTMALNWQAVSAFTDKRIYCLLEDKPDRLLVGTVSGLYAVNIKDLKQPLTRLATNDNQSSDAKKSTKETPKEPPKEVETDSIRASILFQGRTYLANFERGLEELKDNHRTLIWPASKAVLCLYNDNNKRLWLGTISGEIYSYDGSQVRQETELVSLKPNPVRAIGGSSEKSLWIGTGGGLYRYAQRRLDMVLPRVNVDAIVANQEQDSVWCGTDGNGLFKIALDPWVGTITAKLDNEHGLPSDRIFHLLMVGAKANERLWITTSRGVAYYQPGEIAPFMRATRILGSHIYQPEELAYGLSLEYPQNNLVLDVAAASSRTFPEQFQYLFLLFDSKNRLINKPRLGTDAQFFMEKLSSGYYRVEARAYSSDLVPSEPLTFNFTVAKAPFPWTTLALSVLLGLSLFALWWGYHQNNRLADTNATLATTNLQLADTNDQLAETRLQLANETETERRRIARDLHDQTLADLRRLIMLTDQMPTSLDGDFSAKAFRTEIETVSTEIRRICEDLSPSVLMNVGLTAALEWSLTNGVSHLPPAEKFEYEFICNDELEDELKFDATTQIQLYRIVQEAVSNICHHAQAKRVQLSITLEPDNLFVVRLEDDGRGFSQGRKTGRGLSNIRSRASLIEAEVDWQPREPQGTIFIMRRLNKKADKSRS